MEQGSLSEVDGDTRKLKGAAQRLPYNQGLDPYAPGFLHIFPLLREAAKSTVASNGVGEILRQMETACNESHSTGIYKMLGQMIYIAHPFFKDMEVEAAPLQPERF